MGLVSTVLYTFKYYALYFVFFKISFHVPFAFVCPLCLLYGAHHGAHLKFCAHSMGSATTNGWTILPQVIKNGTT